jgi:glyoxylase-like metal-dependent hydrolase (beta-lactamase superfamily II)
MRRAWILAALVGLGAVAVEANALLAEQPAQQNVAEIQKVKDNLYVITGGGGNTAAFLTDKGVVLVDTKLANWGQAILDKVKTVTDKPIVTIINTHTHGDHVGSNEFFPASVEIVTHENTKANMERMDAVKSKPQAMPDRTLKDTMSLGSGKERVDLYYFGRGHTNGDIFVVFRELRTVHTGDLFAAKATPFMDGSNGASGVQYPETLAKAAKGIRNVDTVIPGHSAVTDWATFQEFGEFVRAFVSSVQSSAKAGKTPDQALTDLKVPEKFSAYTLTNQRTKGNVELIYKEMGKLGTSQD